MEAGKLDQVGGCSSLYSYQTQVKDPESGDVYFWNINTDETTWDVPEGVEASVSFVASCVSFCVASLDVCQLPP